MKVNLKAISIAVAMCFSQGGWAATFTFVAPSQGMPSPTQVGTFEESATGTNVPANQVVGADHSLGTLTLGDSITKVFSFKHSVNKNIYNIAATVDYAGSNDISTQIKCTPPLTLTSADAEEVCDAYVTYSAYSNTYDPEFFTINLKGYGSSTEYVAGSFMFSATVVDVVPPSSDVASLAFHRTAADINSASLIVGDSFSGNLGPRYRTVFVTNSGTASASSIVVNSPSDSRFSVQDDQCSTVSVPVNESCSFNLVFTPQPGDVVDTYFSSISLSYFDGSANTNVISSAIQGGVVDSTSGVVFLPSTENPDATLYSIIWNNVVNGAIQTPAKTITVKNNSAQDIWVYPELDLNVMQYSRKSAADLFSIISSTCGDSPNYSRAADYDMSLTASIIMRDPSVPALLPAQATCELTVRYAPDFAWGEFSSYSQGSAPLLIKNQAGQVLASTSVSGSLASTPAGATLVLDAIPDGDHRFMPVGVQTPVSVEFNPLNMSSGATAAQLQLNVVNIGNAAASNVNTTISGSSDFSLDYSDCSGTVAAKNTCSVYLNFTPSNETSSTPVPATVTISGTGMATLNVPVQGTVSGITAATSIDIIPANQLMTTRLYNINYSDFSYDIMQAIAPASFYNYDVSAGELSPFVGVKIFKVVLDTSEQATVESINILSPSGQAFETMGMWLNQSPAVRCIEGHKVRMANRDTEIAYGPDYYMGSDENACFIGVRYTPNGDNSYAFTLQVNMTTSSGNALTATEAVSGTWTSGAQDFKY